MGDRRVGRLDLSLMKQQYQIPQTTGKTLVAYYSASGTTERIAEYIAEEMDADVFVITPVNAYTSADLNWSDSGSRVVQEHEHPNTRHVELVQTTPDNFADYDNVFIGYPIWWQEAAWVVDDFVKENDFTGKNVIPFCTSMSSPLGESGTKLAAMAGTGNWLEGMRFSSRSTRESVQEWAAGLDLTKTGNGKQHSDCLPFLSSAGWSRCQHQCKPCGCGRTGFRFCGVHGKCDSEEHRR